MIESRDTPGKPSPPASKPAYDKPGFAWEADIEAEPRLMSICGKLQFQGGPCAGGEFAS